MDTAGADVGPLVLLTGTVCKEQVLATSDNLALSQRVTPLVWNDE